MDGPGTAVRVSRERRRADEWAVVLAAAGTAPPLPAAPPRLLGNAVAAAVLLTAVCWYLGAGVGLGLTLLAGAGGNALTALVHHADHVSVGASTAVFGAIGILAALRI